VLEFSAEELENLLLALLSVFVVWFGNSKSKRCSDMELLLFIHQDRVINSVELMTTLGLGDGWRVVLENHPLSCSLFLLDSFTDSVQKAEKSPVHIHL